MATPNLRQAEQDIQAALEDMHAAEAAGRLADIGPPSSSDDMAALLAEVPTLPPDVVQWCRACSYAVFEWVRLLGSKRPHQGTTIVDHLDVILVPGWMPVASDQFGCLYCVDTSQPHTAQSVFFTEFAAHDSVIYHAASSFPKFLRIVARAVVNGDPDWAYKKDFVLAIDPELANVPNVLLPWVVLESDSDAFNG